MGKVNDIKAYWKEQAVKAGLDGDTLKQVEPLLDNPAFLKSLTDGFKPLPDYSADLDSVRDRTKAETTQQYKDWYAQEQAKYQAYLSVLDEHAKYKTLYGDLNDTNAGGAGGANRNGNPNPNGAGSMSKEEIEQLLNDRMAQRDANALDYMEIRERHLTDFKKPLDRKAFEQFWREHPDYSTMTSAYKEFVAPELQKARDQDLEARMKAKYEEGLRDGATRRGLPISSANREFSPLLDQKQDVLKLSERDQETHSRKSFFEALNNPNGDQSAAKP